MRRPLDTVSETIGDRAAAELERLRAEESLRRSEERFRTLYDDNPSMYFTLSPEGMVLSVNRFGAAQLGYTADELVGRSVLDVFDPADHQTVLKQLVQCASTPHTIFAWELQKVRKDRTRLWVRERARAVPDAEGTLTILVVCEDVTEHRKTTQLLATLVRESPLPIVSLDPDARVTSWNQAATRLFGWSEHDVLGRELPYVPPGQERAADALWEQGARGEIAGPIELRRRRKDGAMLDLLLWPVFVYDESGRLSTAVGLYVDQSDLKRAEAARLKSEARLRSFLDALDDLACEFDAQGTYLNFWTRNDENLLLPRQTVVGKTISDLFEAEESARCMSTIQRVLATGRPEPVEYAVPIKGRLRYFLAIMSRIPAAGNAGATVACVARDITDLRQAEAALRASEARLQRFVAEAPVGFIILDDRRRLLSANKAFCALTGYEEHELVGRTYDSCVHPAEFPVQLAVTEECSRGGRSESQIEQRYVRKCGTTIWVSVKATHIELPNHPGPLLLAVVQDVTERRRAAEERERLSQDLHDNILQSLYAVGMQLEAGKLSLSRTPRKAKVHTTQAIDQLNYLVGEIRQFIALLMQQTAPKLDFGQALRQLVGNFSAAGQAAPELDINDRVVAMVTAEQAEQLLNIAREALSNSMRHAQAAHRWVRLSRSDRAVRLQIRDDGVGFDPRRKRKRGHGLVNMAARAEKIGARFSLASAPDGGTCITVELPREEEQ